MIFESLQRSASPCEFQLANCVLSARRPETGVFVREELLAIPPNTTLPPIIDIQQAPCGSHPAAPTVCRNAHSAPAYFGYMFA